MKDYNKLTEIIVLTRKIQELRKKFRNIVIFIVPIIFLLSIWLGLRRMHIVGYCTLTVGLGLTLGWIHIDLKLKESINKTKEYVERLEFYSDDELLTELFNEIKDL